MSSLSSIVSKNLFKCGFWEVINTSLVFPGLESALFKEFGVHFDNTWNKYDKNLS